METKKNSSAAVAEQSSNAGLLASLNLGDANYKSRDEIISDIVKAGNGEIVTFDKLISLTEVVTYDDKGEQKTFDSLRIEMPAGAIKLTSHGNDSYTIQRATKPFFANASYASKMHKDGKRVLCEVVAAGQMSLLSDKTNDNNYMIVIYHIF